jgi:hypothetical protein
MGCNKSSTVLEFIDQVLLQFSWRRGSKDSRSQGFKDLLSKDFISTLNIKGIGTTDHLVYKIRPHFLPLRILLSFHMSLNRVLMTFARLSSLYNSLAFYLNP